MKTYIRLSVTGSDKCNWLEIQIHTFKNKHKINEVKNDLWCKGTYWASIFSVYTNVINISGIVE